MASISLAQGLTAYELQGPPSAPLVVLLHGGTVPMWVWDRQVPALLAAGYRTLRYDMFGKGLSASPRARYDRALYQAQLLGLLEALGLEQPFHLVGYSFGGATAALFASRHATRLRSLALLSPAVHYAQGRGVLRIVRLPLLGALFLRTVVMPQGSRRAARLWAGADPALGYQQRFDAQMQQSGFARALLSYLRSDALGDYGEAYRLAGEQLRRCLLVWGTRDQEIPAAHIARLRQLMPALQFHALDGIGHGSLFQASEAVNRLLLEHLALAEQAPEAA